jgi:hypothetical protein
VVAICQATIRVKVLEFARKRGIRWRAAGRGYGLVCPASRPVPAAVQPLG